MKLVKGERGRSGLGGFWEFIGINKGNSGIQPIKKADRHLNNPFEHNIFMIIWVDVINFNM